MLEEGLELFATKGYHATKVSDIVKQAGVAQGTFYWYFSSKEEIAVRVIEEGQGRLLQVIHQGYRKRIGTVPDMIASSEKLIRELLEFAEDNRNLMILLFLKGQGAAPPVRSAVSKTFTLIEDAFANNINRAMDLNMLERHDAVGLRAQMITTFITGMIARWLFGPEQSLDYVPTDTIEEIAGEMVNFEFFGLFGAGRA